MGWKVPSFTLLDVRIFMWLLIISHSWVYLGDRALDTIKNPRLVRIKERTMWWRYQMLYVPGKKQAAADALSRKRLPVALHTLGVVDKGDMEGELVDKLVLQLEEITMFEREAGFNNFGEGCSLCG
jgi:hypothetical protein